MRILILALVCSIAVSCRTTKTSIKTTRDTTIASRMVPYTIDTSWIRTGFQNMLIPMDSLLGLKLDSFTHTLRYQGVSVTTKKEGSHYTQSVSKAADTFHFHHYFEVPVHDTTIIIYKETEKTVKLSWWEEKWMRIKDFALVGLLLVAIVLLIIVLIRK